MQMSLARKLSACKQTTVFVWFFVKTACCYSIFHFESQTAKDLSFLPNYAINFWLRSSFLPQEVRRLKREKNRSLTRQYIPTKKKEKEVLFFSNFICFSRVLGSVRKNKIVKTQAPSVFSGPTASMKPLKADLSLIRRLLTCPKIETNSV